MALDNSVIFCRALYGVDDAYRLSAPSGGVLFSCWVKIPDPGASPWNHGTNLIVLRLFGSDWHVTGVAGNCDSTGFYNANTMFFLGDPGGVYWAGDFSMSSHGGYTEAEVKDWVWVAWHVVLDVTNQVVHLDQWLKFGATGTVVEAGSSTVSLATLRASAISDGGCPPATANAWTITDAVSIYIGGDFGGDTHLWHARVEATGGTAPTLSHLETISALTGADTSAWADWRLDWESGAANLADRSGNARNLTLEGGGTLYQGYAAPYDAAPSGAIAGTIAGTAGVGTVTLQGLVQLTAALPTWTSADIGTTGAAGSATPNANGTITVAGAGADIWGTADAFQFYYAALEGDCVVTARVASIQNTDPWAKAGVMIRESLAAGSTYTASFITPANSYQAQCRLATNDISYSGAAGQVYAAPGWVRVVRSGNTLSGWYSLDGITWVQDGTPVTISMATAYVGLAVSSHVAGTLNTSTFREVNVQKPGAVTAQAIASGTLTGTAAPSGDIAGTIAGAAANTATLTGSGALAGTIAGACTAAATPALSGKVAGTSTVTATPTISGKIAGTASIGTITLLGAGVLAATAAGVTTTAAPLLGVGALAGTIANTSAPRATPTISGKASGVSTVAGVTSGEVPIAASTNCTAGNNATLLGKGALAGTSTGVATAAAGVGGESPVRGTSAGTSTATATPSLAGKAAGMATPAATLLGAGVLAGTIAGTTTAPSALAGKGALAGSATGTSTATATASPYAAAVGTVPGTATTAGTMLGAGALTGRTAGAAVVQAFTEGSARIEGVAAGVSAPRADIMAFASISAVVQSGFLASADRLTAVTLLVGAALHGFTLRATARAQTSVGGTPGASMAAEPTPSAGIVPEGTPAATIS